MPPVPEGLGQFVSNELVAEGFESVTGTTNRFRLTGVDTVDRPSYEFTALQRLDGSSVETDDYCHVTFEDGDGQIAIAVCRIILGVSTELEVLTDFIYQPETGGFPSMTGGVAYISIGENSVARTNPITGELLRGSIIREKSHPPSAESFAADLAIVDGERASIGVAGLGPSPTLGQSLNALMGGEFVYDENSTAAVDNKHVFMPNNGVGRIVRAASLNASVQHLNVPAGTAVVALDILSIPIETRRNGCVLTLNVSSSDGASFLNATVIVGPPIGPEVDGFPTDPPDSALIDIVVNHQRGELNFVDGDTGTNIQIQSTSSAAMVAELALGRLQ